MRDPYYPEYLYYRKETSKQVTYKCDPKYLITSNNEQKYGIFLSDHPYLPASSDSLDSMIHDTRKYGLDITDLIMQDKLQMLKASASLLRSQIDERSKLRDENITTIEGKIMRCEGYIDSLAEIWPRFVNPMVEAKRANLYHEVSNLDSLKLRETVSCWGDQIRLYSELLNTLGEYQAAARRFQLLDGDDA